MAKHVLTNTLLMAITFSTFYFQGCVPLVLYENNVEPFAKDFIEASTWVNPGEREIVWCPVNRQTTNGVPRAIHSRYTRTP